jgi:5-methylcytosine-specific restriction endonuclease McrA
MGALDSFRRTPGSTARGGGFDAATIAAVWMKGSAVPGHHPNQVRRDCCGALMHYSAYGDTNSEFGWEIDHERPVAHGGGDELANLQPLYWRNNRRKGDDWPQWSCGYSAP